MPKFDIHFDVTVKVNLEVEANTLQEAMDKVIATDAEDFKQGDGSWLLAPSYMDGELIGEQTLNNAYGNALGNNPNLKGEEVDTIP